ncbi:21604_t:CDS:2 [Rhizophagus irregularis]|nr:21604_t:CDS:2 [Rhizophagus irregularis]
MTKITNIHNREQDRDITSNTVLVRYLDDTKNYAKEEIILYYLKDDIDSLDCLTPLINPGSHSTTITFMTTHGHLTKAIWHVNNDASKAWEKGVKVTKLKKTRYSRNFSNINTSSARQKQSRHNNLTNDAQPNYYSGWVTQHTPPTNAPRVFRQGHFVPL